MGYKIKDITSKPSTAEPVQFLSSKERFFFFVEENRTLVWVGILLAVAVIVAIVALSWLSQHKQEQAWELEGQAQSVYLDRPLDDVKKSQENIQKASTMFKEILDQYPGTASAEVASFLLGNSLMEEGNYQGAIDVYTSFIQQYPQNEVFVGLVQQRLGLAYLLTGNREASMKAFEAVLANPHAFNKDQVVFEMAKLAEADKKVGEAVIFYKKIVQEFPLSPFASEAALRVKVLAPEEAEDSSTPEKRDDGEVQKKSSETLPVQDEGAKE
jgi:outer membrane protein assembly factor BamD (BamD/ComL family)